MKKNRLITLFGMLFFSVVLFAQTIEIDKAKTEITELLKKGFLVSKAKEDKSVHYAWGNQKNVFALEDRIEFKLKKDITIFYYNDIVSYNITYTIVDKVNSGVLLGDFLLTYKGLVNGKELADNLIYIQRQAKNSLLEKQYEPLTLFEPIAANYRTLKIKPEISEEQRKYIVQANFFNKQRNTEKAIEQYKNAINIDPTTYPAAYMNMALLYAQLNEFYAAIYHMKKYLMLLPDVEDARSAQDQIYEWEAQLK